MILIIVAIQYNRVSVICMSAIRKLLQFELTCNHRMVLSRQLVERISMLLWSTSNGLNLACRHSRFGSPQSNVCNYLQTIFLISERVMLPHGTMLCTRYLDFRNVACQFLLRCAIADVSAYHVTSNRCSDVISKKSSISL